MRQQQEQRSFADADWRFRGSAEIFLLVLAAWLVVLGCFNLRHPSDWAMGDWLINYSGGFVRRGLIGEFAWLLRRVGLPLLWTVLLLQWSLYAIILTTVWHLMRGVRWSWWVTALVVSPSTLAFVLLDPPFAYRKEILLFALTCLVIMSFLRGRAGVGSDESQATRLTLLLTLGCGICVLAHEALIVYFPYLFAAVFLGYRELRRATWILVLPTAVSVALFLLVSYFPGNEHTAEVVCTSIGGQMTSPPSGICGGAIAYLTRTPAYAHEEVRRELVATVSSRLVPALFVMPFLPVIFGLSAFRRRSPFAFWLVLGSAVLAGAFSVSLFYYGTDWTRWIYIHAFSLMLLMLFAEHQRESSLPMTKARVVVSQRPRTLAGAVGLVIYALGWELTIYGQRPLYASFVRYVTHHLIRGQQ